MKYINILSACVGLTCSVSANASIVDLTTANSSGTINGAQFYQYSANLPVGTGVFGPFLRVQNNGVESGFNTNGALQFDSKPGSWTHAVKLGDIPLINGYRQFSLDINEAASKTNSLLSLDEVQLFITSDANLTGYNTGTRSFGSSATKVYDMDSPVGLLTANNWVKLDYALSGSGSGRADMLMYVPDSYFLLGGATAASNVVMFTKFGTNFAVSSGLGASAGFEEWSVNKITAGSAYTPTPIPVPAAAWLLGSGLIGLVGVARRKDAAI